LRPAFLWFFDLEYLCFCSVAFFVFASCILHFGTHLKKEAVLQRILVCAVCASLMLLYLYVTLSFEIELWWLYTT
jgi:hypothetical protein